MFAKLATLILTMGLIAAVLLATRQQRVQAARDLAQVQQRVAGHDHTLWRLRLEIAARLKSDLVENAAVKLGPLVPISAERFRELVRRESEQSALTSLDPVLDAQP